jgi:hypothetical protein
VTAGFREGLVGFSGDIISIRYSQLFGFERIFKRRATYSPLIKSLVGIPFNTFNEVMSVIP